MVQMCAFPDSCNFLCLKNGNWISCARVSVFSFSMGKISTLKLLAANLNQESLGTPICVIPYLNLMWIHKKANSWPAFLNSMVHSDVSSMLSKSVFVFGHLCLCLFIPGFYFEESVEFMQHIASLFSGYVRGRCNVKRNQMCEHVKPCRSTLADWTHANSRTGTSRFVQKSKFWI